MSDGRFQRWVVEVMSGRARDVPSRVLRTALAAAEPAYAGVAAARNRRFDRDPSAVHKLARPVISVGNITTGGTGKTPAVQWLVRALAAQGRKPGILLRGYGKRDHDAQSDEEQLLRETLGVPVVANPDRVAGAASLLEAHPDVDVIVLDDGFQHRRVARDLDIVLIDATNPFGFEHVLPRGLLREPLVGLARAGLFVITRTDQVRPAVITAIESRLRDFNTTAAVTLSMHRLTHALAIDDTRIELEALRGKRAYALSGIGNPKAFERSLSDVGAIVIGDRHFADHHAYQPADLAKPIEEAGRAKADWILTTEKDWVKLGTFEAAARSTCPFARVVLALTFQGTGEATAMAAVNQAIA